MIQKIRENLGTIVICAVIVVGVPAVASTAATSTPESEPIPSMTVDLPVFSHSGGTNGASESNSGAGGAWGEDD